VPEVFAGPSFPAAAAVIAAVGLDVDPATAVLALLAIWYGAEAALNRAAGWHCNWQSPFAWMLRDALLPALWIEGWVGNTFVWRGNDMSVSKGEARASVRTTVREFASKVF
jgi:ceramide glucosyltransferase